MKKFLKLEKDMLKKAQKKFIKIIRDAYPIRRSKKSYGEDDIIIFLYTKKEKRNG